MVHKTEVLTAVGTLCCAVGIGFVMQNSAVAEKRYGPKASSFVIRSEASLRPTLPADVLLQVTDITLTSADIVEDAETVEEPEEVIIDAVTRTDDVPDLIDIDQLPEVIETADVVQCKIDATAEPGAAAFVHLTLSAPCLPDELVTLHHNGMIFKEKTSSTGSLDLLVPALTEDAQFIFAFPMGEGAIASAQVPELKDYDRAVLQWKGDAGFQIHAREFGASYGEQGHRWADAPGSLDYAVGGISGVLTRHGIVDTAEPLLAEVYTFPRKTYGKSGNVVLTVEAEVTFQNCGIEVEAQALEMLPDSEVRTRNLILPIPSCDSVGNFLVLNNLLQNLKVAAK